MLATFMLTRLRSDRSQSGGQVGQSDVTSQVEHQDVERVPFSSWNNVKSLKTFSYIALKCDLNKDFLPLPATSCLCTKWSILIKLDIFAQLFFFQIFFIFIIFIIWEKSNNIVIKCSPKKMALIIYHTGCRVSVVFVWTNQNRGRQCGNEKTNMSKQQNWNDLFQRW